MTEITPGTYPRIVSCSICEREFVTGVTPSDSNQNPLICLMCGNK